MIGLPLLTSCIISNLSKISISNTPWINSVTVNNTIMNDSDITFTSNLPILISSNNSGNINFSLNTINTGNIIYSSVNKFITSLTVDSYGRIIDAQLTYPLQIQNNIPANGGNPVSYGPNITNIVVNQYGLITSISSNNYDYLTLLNNESITVRSNEGNLNTLIDYIKGSITTGTSSWPPSSLVDAINGVINKFISTEQILTNNITSISNLITNINSSIITLNTNNTSITNQTTEILNSINALKSSITTETTRAIIFENGISLNITNEITRATQAEIDLNNNYKIFINNFNTLNTLSTTNFNAIGSLINYSITNNLTNILGNLYNCLFINSTYNLSNYINSLGDISIYNKSNNSGYSTSRLIDYIGDLTFISQQNPITISSCIKSYGTSDLITNKTTNSFIANGRQNLLEIIGYNLINTYYSYGPLIPSNQQNPIEPFSRDGYFPLFTTSVNANNWINTNITPVLIAALQRTVSGSNSYINLNTFKTSFTIINIGPNVITGTNSINNIWKIVLPIDANYSNGSYYLITSLANTAINITINPSSITFINS